MSIQNPKSKTKITQLAFAIILVFGISAFTTTSNAINNTSNNQATQSSTIQRVRIDFTTPTGYVRHLLLAFTSNNAASDGFDYGYDGMVADDFPDDLNWMIEDDRYVSQGVGAFDQTKKYPLGLFLTNSGNFSATCPRQKKVAFFDFCSNTSSNISEL